MKITFVEKTLMLVLIWLVLTVSGSKAQGVIYCPLHSYASCYDTGQIATTGSGAHLYHCSCGDDAWVALSASGSPPLVALAVKSPDIDVARAQTQAAQAELTRAQAELTRAQIAQLRGCTLYRLHWYSNPVCLTPAEIQQLQVKAQQKQAKKSKEK